MRALLFAVLATVAGAPHVADAAPKALVKAPHKLTYDADHLDLDGHKLQFKLGRPAVSAELKVFAEDGSELAKAMASYDKPKPADWLAITWTPSSPARVLRLVLRVTADDGNVSIVELIPWSVTIDHEDVNFASDSATIEPTEATKLDASVDEIKKIEQRTAKLMPLRLYIAGHTDTVGGSGRNRTLSLARAKAIAAYFRTKGIALPIAFAGFGEDVLKVKTKDNADELRNRRADYVLGPAADSPPFKGAYLKGKASWKQLGPAK